MADLPELCAEDIRLLDSEENEECNDADQLEDHAIVEWSPYSPWPSQDSVSLCRHSECVLMLCSAIR